MTSGIRVGTPAVTRRGFNEQDCRELAGWMCDVLDALGKENEEQVIAATKEKYWQSANVFQFMHNADSAFICDVSGGKYRRLFLMWKDKVRAVRHGWRFSEHTFFLLSLLGGFIGVYCGMIRFRHKTKHFSFKFVVILSAFIWLILMSYWYFFLE